MKFLVVLLSLVSLNGYCDDYELSGNWLLAKYDLNGDSVITQAEVSRKKSDFFEHMDADGNQEVSFEEYQQVDQARRERLLKLRFSKLDIDQNGKVTSDEYASYDGDFNALDNNGDGTISASEIHSQSAKNEEPRCLLWFCFRKSLNQ